MVDKTVAQKILEDLQKRHVEDSQKEDTSFPKLDYFKLGPGEIAVVRFLPPKTGLENAYPWREMHLHWGLGPKGSECVLCTQDYQKPRECPICKDVAKYKASGATQLSDKIRAKHRVNFLLINRDGDDEVPLIWDIAYSYFKKFRAMLINPKTSIGLSPFDVENGYDIEIQRMGENTETDYTFSLAMVSTDEGVSAKKTPLFDDPEKIVEVLNKMPDISKIHSFEYTDEQLLEILDGESPSEIRKKYYAENKSSEEGTRKEESSTTRRRR